ncbi:MAG: major facilitator superfamily 1 [Caulobacter sp.]|nr:major facilitator superfamily 1 [Caulobacter sp.]
MATLPENTAKRLAFWAGCLVVTIGVLLHLPMFLMARDMDWAMAGMPMDAGTFAGMGLIVVGIGMTSWGLLPPAEVRHAEPHLHMSASEDAPLTGAHWSLMIVLIVALVVDVMKPASLGFVVPGMREEYGVTKAFVAWLPFTALTGTFVGSLIWGWLADVYGRRASILLSSIMFVGTSICGAMPSFGWNVAMCFLMGAAAGGLLPVVYALLAETMPSRHRGWSLVMVGGLGAAGGYLAASSLSAVLQPMFGWRIMWFLNLPTGLALIFLSGWIPESAKFLMQNGRVAEARAILARFGSVLLPDAPVARAAAAEAPTSNPAIKTAILALAGMTWSLVNFGVLLWLPAELVSKGYSIGLTSKLLAESALIALPTVAIAALLYSRWSTKGALAVLSAATGAGLVGVILVDTPLAGLTLDPILPVALLIFGSTGMLAVLLPYTAELFPARVRGRATGLVAGCTKAGGLIAQGLGLMALIPVLATAAWAVLALLVAVVGLVTAFGEETRGRDLRDTDEPAPA